MTQVMPTLEEVLEYSEDQIKFHIRSLSRIKKLYIPEEQQDEIAQDARMRIAVAYKKLDPSRGWKTFAQSHCFGAVADYISRGRGFEDNKWMKNAKKGDHTALRFREHGPTDEDGEPTGIENIVGMEEAYEQNWQQPNVVIKWDLVARMCSADKDLHIFVRHCLLGHTLVDLSKHFGLTRERIGQRMDKFVKSLDDASVNNRWLYQIIYALGLCGEFHMPEVDQDCGWQLPAVDFTQDLDLGGESQGDDPVLFKAEKILKTKAPIKTDQFTRIEEFNEEDMEDTQLNFFEA